MAHEPVGETDINDTELLAAGYIIGNLDDNGYLTRTLPQILDDLAINAGLELTMEQLVCCSRPHPSP